VTFEGLEAHVFEDDRKEAAGKGARHPFDDPASQGAAVLLVNANFGCGSSREHAPQALWRRGIRAVVGESFAEIFFGNSLMMGLPCLTSSREDVARLMTIAKTSPDVEFVVELPAGRVTAGAVTVEAAMPPTARDALISGAWDATGSLVQDYEVVERVASRLPYVKGF
jgi:3-isopropylmalate/(R)-2-methylmalate dehydratase small subunit